MTYADCITDALRLIHVLGHFESADADQGALGVSALNDMMAAWEADGILVGYVQSTVPTDDLNLHATAREAVKYNLALKLCPFYEREPSAVVVAGARSGYDSLLLAAVINAQEESDMRHVPRGTARSGLYNAVTGLIR